MISDPSYNPKSPPDDILISFDTNALSIAIKLVEIVEAARELIDAVWKVLTTVTGGGYGMLLIVDSPVIWPASRPATAENCNGTFEPRKTNPPELTFKFSWTSKMPTRPLCVLIELIVALPPKRASMAMVLAARELMDAVWKVLIASPAGGGYEILLMELTPRISPVPPKNSTSVPVSTYTTPPDDTRISSNTVILSIVASKVLKEVI